MTNRTAQMIDRLKDHPVAAVIIVASAILIGIQQTTGAFLTLWNYFVGDEVPGVVLTGRMIDPPKILSDSARVEFRSTDSEIEIQLIRLTFPTLLSRRPNLAAKPPDYVADIVFQLSELNRALTPKIPEFVSRLGAFCRGVIPLVAQVDYIYRGDRYVARSLYEIDFIQAVEQGERELGWNNLAEVTNIRFVRHLNSRENSDAIVNERWKTQLPMLTFE